MGVKDAVSSPLVPFICVVVFLAILICIGFYTGVMTSICIMAGPMPEMKVAYIIVKASSVKMQDYLPEIRKDVKDSLHIALDDNAPYFRIAYDDPRSAPDGLARNVIGIVIPDDVAMPEACGQIHFGTFSAMEKCLKVTFPSKTSITPRIGWFRVVPSLVSFDMEHKSMEPFSGICEFYGIERGCIVYVQGHGAISGVLNTFTDCKWGVN